MKTHIINILYGLLLGMVMASCASNDDVVEWVKQPTDTTTPVAREVELLVSIGDRAMKSRRSPMLTHRAATFNGMELLVAIPYHTDGDPVDVTDEPLIDLVGADQDNLTKENETEKYNTYYVDRCQLMTGTDRMLVYGRATPVSPDSTINGKLYKMPTIRTKTENITFSLASIRSTTEPHDDAKALAAYMTKIANSTGWSTTEDPTLKSYYMDFIRSKGEGGGLMSGAAANIKAFVAALKELLEGRTDAVSTAIKNNIDGTDISGNTYPSSIGLPDGAAVIRWTGTEFEVRTTTTTLDNINGINRYTCPAELVFFADSPIRTSETEVKKTDYQVVEQFPGYIL